MRDCLSGTARLASRRTGHREEIGVGTAQPCNFWQHNIVEYIFYIQIVSAVTNLPSPGVGYAKTSGLLG
jgi:hypothetical protein